MIAKENGVSWTVFGGDYNFVSNQRANSHIARHQQWMTASRAYKKFLQSDPSEAATWRFFTNRESGLGIPISSNSRAIARFLTRSPSGLIAKDDEASLRTFPSSRTM